MTRVRQTVAPAMSTQRLEGSSTEATKSQLADIPVGDYEWICIDLFDTLVTRTVHPEDVKRLACQRLARVATPNISGGSLYRLRASVERETCQRNAESGLDLEFSLGDCLASIAERIPSLAAEDRAGFVRLGIETEIAVECSVQGLDPDISEFVQSLAGRGIRSALVSDFYLRAPELRRILRFHDMDEVFEHVFSSADDLLSKRSGRKYPVVIEALGCDPGRVLMVGDNPVADVEQARANGLAAFHVDRIKQHGHYTRMAKGSGDLKRIESEIDAALYSDETAVFPELALTLYCFIERLYEALLAREVRDVFFFSREGQPLQRLFDSYQSTRAPTESISIRSHYLEVSRRSLFLPSLAPLDDESFEVLFRQYRRISWGEFLLSLGLDDLIEDLRPTLDSDPEVRLDDLPTSPEFATLLREPRFQAHYEAERVRRREAFLAYLDGFPSLQHDQPLTVIDVGWKGTMQDNLVNLLAASGRNDVAVDGLYVGLVAPGAAGPTNTKTGVLYSSIGGRSPWFHVFDENRSLAEAMLAADHGSTAAYRLDAEGSGVPVRGAFPEEPMVSGQIMPAQRNLEERFHRLDQLLMKRRYSPRWLLDLTAQRHARMVFGATPREIQWFTQLYHVENFGVFEKSTFGYQRLGGPWQRARFTVSLLRVDGRRQLGFWPWLQCVQQGGRVAGIVYRVGRQLRASTCHRRSAS